MYFEKMGEGTVTVGNGLIDAILAFLDEQRLEPTPINYAFAYHVMADPAGPLAREVGRRTDGGVRLTSGEVETLGTMIEGAPAATLLPIVATLVDPSDTLADATAAAEALALETRRQVAGFETIVSAMRSETRDFGRDLAASEDALRRSTPKQLRELNIRVTADGPKEG